tara:strand:- start:73 stop:840 length:768 start_codon:yes stop_codon:yes gene_type:complete
MNSSHPFRVSILLGLFFLLLWACQEDESEDFIQVKTEEQQNDSIPKNRFTDSRDGNEYTYVNIGQQVWMAENLRYIPAVVPSDSSSYTQALYYVYGYQGEVLSQAKASANYQTYGVLYNFAAATQGGESDLEIPGRVKGVCPEGWHLPSDVEWTQLTDFLGGRAYAGGKLKATDTTYWKPPNIAATNETGFTALAGGIRASDGTFLGIRENGYWWSSTANGPSIAWFRNMFYLYGDVYRIDFYKDAGFCVRCIRD